MIAFLQLAGIVTKTSGTVSGVISGAKKVSGNG